MRDVSGDDHGGGLRIHYSAIYHAEWDARPDEYVAAELVGWGRSRRLAKLQDPACHFVAYVGIHHADPARWNLPGESAARFFASILVGGRTLELRTYATMDDALGAIRAAHARIHDSNECYSRTAH
jgi:hypothetical protein